MYERVVVCDVETDSLNPSKVWVVVCKELDGDIKVFERPDLNSEPLVEYAKGVSKWIGHNFIQFDFSRVFNVFFPGLIPNPVDQIIDTLVISRTINYDAVGGHGLASWGKRVGINKPHIEDFSQGLSNEMIERCVEDVKITEKVFKFLRKHYEHPSYQEAMKLEHQMVFVCDSLNKVGFGFNEAEASRLYKEIEQKLEKLDEEIIRYFPPKAKPIREICPTLTKKGFLNAKDFKWLGDSPNLSPFTADAPFTVIEWQNFNPASPSQIVKRLNEAGWKPTEKTKGHIDCERNLKRERDKEKRLELTERLKEYRENGWSVSEDNLNTLPASAPPGAFKLAQRITLASRLSTLNEWLKAYNPETQSIHGTFNHIGAWTGRMSHAKPNAANIPGHPDVRDDKNPSPVERIKLDYSLALRSLWCVRPGRRLVGVDADGIQLRVLSHYMEDAEYTEAVSRGDKKLGTDVHSLNAKRLGTTRPVAKTYIYAWVLNAGLDKQAEILYTDREAARSMEKRFLELTPALKFVKDVLVPRDAEKGYFTGLDGRLVPVPNKHKVLAGYLQNGEAIIMKKACLAWRTKLKKEKIPFWHTNFVHDEWQVETIDDDDIANYVAQTMIESIVQTGENLNLKCPLAGEAKFGYNWKETH